MCLEMNEEISVTTSLFMTLVKSNTVGPRITLLMVPEKYVVMRNSAMRITTYKR